MDVRVWGTAGDRLVEVCAEPAPDSGGLRIEGLPQARLRTTTDRTRAALVNSGLLRELPAVVVRLDPGVMAGVTNALDLPIALAVLARAGMIVGVRWIFAGGRLGLDGRIYADGLDESPSIVTAVTALRSAQT